MTRDLSESIDEYCEEQYGHTNWAYLDTCDKEDLKEPHDIEGNIIFFHNEIEDEEEDDYTHCDGCDDYFLDDERCECEEG